MTARAFMPLRAWIMHVLVGGILGSQSWHGRYGIGKWDEMARDERLRLGEKLALAATEKKGKDAKDVEPTLKHLPKGGSSLFSITSLSGIVPSAFRPLSEC